MNTTEAGKLLTLMAAAIPGASMNATAIRDAAVIWAKLFAAYPYPVVESAAVKALETHVYANVPAPAVILNALKAQVSAGEPDALSAWAEVQNAIDYHGRYQEAEALAAMSPRTAWVVKRMGWEGLCNTEIEATAVIRAQFTKLYEHSLEQSPDIKALPESRRAIGQAQAKDALAMIALGGTK